MKSNINFTPLKKWASIEVYWKQGNEYNLRPSTFNYPDLPKAELIADGWRDVVVPSYDPKTQKLGALEYDSVNDVVTYPVIDLTPEEISQREKALVPYSITPTQGRIQLSRMGILPQVVSIVETSTDEELKVYWEYALSWDLDNKHILSMSNLLGMTESDLDDFFIEASLIT